MTFSNTFSLLWPFYLILRYDLLVFDFIELCLFYSKLMNFNLGKTLLDHQC